MLNCIARWVSSKIRLQFEEVLTVARTQMDNFDLADENSEDENRHNFHLATYLSFYLHAHQGSVGFYYKVSSLGVVLTLSM